MTQSEATPPTPPPGDVPPAQSKADAPIVRSQIIDLIRRQASANENLMNMLGLYSKGEAGDHYTKSDLTEELQTQKT